MFLDEQWWRRVWGGRLKAETRSECWTPVMAAPWRLPLVLLPAWASLASDTLNSSYKREQEGVGGLSPRLSSSLCLELQMTSCYLGLDKGTRDPTGKQRPLSRVLSPCLALHGFKQSPLLILFFSLPASCPKISALCGHALKRHSVCLLTTKGKDWISPETRKANDKSSIGVISLRQRL